MPKSVPTPTESKVAASLAHEINNPLDSLLNLLHLIANEGNLTDRGRHYLSLAEEEVQRIARMTRAALHAPHCETVQATNVPDLMGSVIDLYKDGLADRGIAVAARYGPDGELAVFPGPLRQAFSNLLLNAAAAMPEGGRIQARVARGHEWSGQHRQGIRMTFADTGSGISAQNLHHIFEPFFTTKGAGGCGLGLSLVKDVVQQHGGSLRVRSSTIPGHSGSVFTIFIPATPKSECRIAA